MLLPVVLMLVASWARGAARRVVVLGAPRRELQDLEQDVLNPAVKTYVLSPNGGIFSLTMNVCRRPAVQTHSEHKKSDYWAKACVYVSM